MMTCVRIYFEIDNKLHRDDFCHFDKCTEESAINCFKTRMPRNAEIKKVIMAETWEELE